jgi:hypothetical protein
MHIFKRQLPVACKKLHLSKHFAGYYVCEQIASSVYEDQKSSI